MTKALTAEQWTALRLLREGEAEVTLDLCAQGAGHATEDIRAALDDAEKGISHPWLLTTQLAAMRQLLDGKPPTLDRIAALGACHVTTLTRRALKQGWKTPFIDHWQRRVRAELNTDLGVAEAVRLHDVAGSPQAPDAGQADMGRAARVCAMLLKHADQLIAQVERQGGVLTRPQIDTMLAMVRLAEKFETAAAEEAAQHQERSDEKVAEALAKIETRIVGLAEELAARMVAERSAAG